MLITRSDPFGALAELQRTLDSFRASDWLEKQTAARGTYPPINVFRQGDNFVAIIELAGINKDDLDVEVKDQLIRVSGKKVQDYPDKSSTHRRERVFGSFDRTISVPVRINPDGLKAEYRNGILALFIPRAEEDKPKRIAVG